VLATLQLAGNATLPLSVEVIVSSGCDADGTYGYQACCGYGVGKFESGQGVPPAVGHGVGVGKTGSTGGVPEALTITVPFDGALNEME
jgi:hypothetical protein